jgi:hypothetical protein
MAIRFKVATLLIIAGVLVVSAAAGTLYAYWDRAVPLGSGMALNYIWSAAAPEM